MIQQRAIDLICLGMAITLGVHLGHIPLWMSAPLSLLLVLRWWQMRSRGPRQAPLWIKLPLVALLLLAIVSHYGNLFGRAPGSALAVGLLILKLLETSHPRDVRSSVGFGCFVLMSALLFNQGMGFTALVLLGLVPNLAALRAIEPRGPAPTWGQELMPVVQILALALPLALFSFMFVPRLASPLWGAPGPDTGRTGLSSRMTPGNLTELLIDDSPAMRVSFDGQPPPPGQRYFRGWVMSQFDGRTWSHARQRDTSPEAVEATRTIGYRVILEPTGGHILPALDVPLSEPEGARMLPSHELLNFKPLNALHRYAMRSATVYSLQARLDPKDRQRNLALPAGFDPDARALAAGWQQEYGNDHAAIAAAALELFHNGGFNYTLAPAPLGRDSIDDFLFSTREGFCEHYASSFTFLMRAAGVPARVVTGYQGGYWSDLGSYLLVRNSDAHAWGEVWLQGRGWVRYDPTAAVRPERVSLGASAAAGSSAAWYQNSWLQGLRNHWDIVNRWWGKAVVAFNQERQNGLLTPFGISHTGIRQLTLILAIGCSLLLALATLLTLRRRRERDPLLESQRRLERKLARLGLERQPSEGPGDFMQRARRALPAHARQLDMLSKRYMFLRYARHSPTAGDVAAYRRLVNGALRETGQADD
ncbi:MAG: DUF3488 and transglutaminase-like domain-containing protein [Rhodanobacteraceae bacterium]